MFSDNLPPGVSPDMIPGNSQSDIDFFHCQNLFDKAYDEHHLTVEDVEILLTYGIKNLDKLREEAKNELSDRN